MKTLLLILTLLLGSMVTFGSSGYSGSQEPRQRDSQPQQRYERDPQAYQQDEGYEDEYQYQDEEADRGDAPANDAYDDGNYSRSDY